MWKAPHIFICVIHTNKAQRLIVNQSVMVGNAILKVENEMVTYPSYLSSGTKKLHDFKQAEVVTIFAFSDCRQLSVERDTLRNSLERESAKSKRLSLENEELQWRLVNSTSPPNSPNVEERPLPAMSNQNSFRLSASFPDPEVIDE